MRCVESSIWNSLHKKIYMSIKAQIMSQKEGEKPIGKII